MVINRGAGYTITEVLVVIAVSGLMFLSATIAFRGRQQQVQFDQAVRDFEGQLSDIMNDVTTGYYVTDNSRTCTVGAGDNNPPTFPPVADNIPGTNADCLYVGKALQFKSGDLLDPDPDSAFRIFNLVGKRYVSSNNPEIAETIAKVKPTVVPSADLVQSIRYGIEITRIVEVVSPTDERDHGIVVFLSNFEGGNLANSVSQSQNVRIAGINSASSSYGLEIDEAVELINLINEDPSSPNGYVDFRSRNGVTFCLTDGTRQASITIGNINAESTLLKIGNVAEECL